MMANFKVIDGPIEEGDSVVQFGSGTRSVWRTGKVVSLNDGKARIKFEIASDGTSWIGFPAIPLGINEIEKIAA